MNIRDNKIWCHNCYKWISKFTDIFIINKDVYCLFCANKKRITHLGFDFEAFPCEYYYLYHKKGQCRTCQEETNCRGDTDNCENELGRECYKADKKEIK
jgi:hypothetical protein